MLYNYFEVHDYLNTHQTTCPRSRNVKSSIIFVLCVVIVPNLQVWLLICLEDLDTSISYFPTQGPVLKRISI